VGGTYLVVFKKGWFVCFSVPLKAYVTEAISWLKTHSLPVPTIKAQSFLSVHPEPQVPIFLPNFCVRT
jgi:hypothetical protein